MKSLWQKVWHWIWWTGWEWTNRVTGEKRDSSPLLKITCIFTWVYATFMLIYLLFFYRG